jgi:uncharacterized membrane protein
MNVPLILSIVVIGFSTGLRGLTPLTVVAWCAYLGCLNLHQSPFSFMASPVAGAIFSVLAIGEYVWDLLPNTPNRTDPPGLVARILNGSFAAACLLAAANVSLAFCILGGAAAIVGAFGGMKTRSRLVKSLGVDDPWIAIPEDLIAIGLALIAVYLAAYL